MAVNRFEVIEGRLLELAHTTDARITAPALAYFAPCSVENAQRVLDDLAARGQLSMDVQDDGSITYELLGRQKLEAPTRALTLRREVELSPLSAPTRSSSPLVAGLLSLWIPGAGHLYAGHVFAAFLWFLAVGAGYALILPGLVLHLFCIVSAATTSARQRSQAPRLLGGPLQFRQLSAAPSLHR
jgi:hypothetical protein